MRPGGKLRSVGSAILTNFDQVEAALAAMEDAEGSADSEMSIITESLEYKMNNLRETWTGIAQDVFDRDDLGGFIDGLAAISEGLGGIIDNLGLLGTVATGLGGFLGFRNADNLFSFLSGNFVSGNTAKKNTKAVASNLLNAFDSFESGKGNGYAKLINTINETDFSKVTNELQTLKKQFDSGEISIGEFGAKIKEVQTNTVTLGDSIKNVLKSLGGAALTAGISAIASLAISSIVDAIDKWINRAQYAKEAMEQSFTEFEAAKEEYESINAEIETNKQEMAELEALGSSINSIEKERLSTLKQQTAELEMQAFYAKEKQDTEAQEALRDWENYFNETYYQPEGAGAVGAFLLELLGGLAGGTAAGYASSWANELFDEPVIDNAIKKYRELIEERDELIDQGAGNVDSKKWENITTQITAQEDVLRQYYSEVLEGLEYFDSLPEEIITENDKEMRDYLKDLRADISVILGGDEYKTTVFDTIIDDTDNLIDNLNMLKKVQGQTEVSTEMLLSAYPRLASAIADTGFTVDEFITYLNESILAEEKAAEEAANLGKTYEEVMENSGAFLDTLEALNGFEWTGFTGDSFSLEDFQSEDMQKLFVVSGQKALGEIEGIEADPKYWREYGQYIEMVNGRLVVNTDLLKENEEILKQQELDNISSALSDLETDYANNTRLINEYSDALRDANAEQVKVDGKWISQDTIDSLYEANSAISLQIDNLHLYAQAIKESSDAWNEWEAAQSSEDQGLYADESVNALNLINQTLNDTEFEDWRKTGTDQYAAALKLFLPEGTELDTTDLDAAQQLIDRIKKYYIAEYDEDTGLATYNKIDPYAVVTDMISAGYIESYMEGDQEKYRLTGEYTMKQIAEGMQLGLPFIEAVFGELSEYDIDFDWADEDPSQMFENLADAHQQWMDAVNKGDYETAHQLWLQMYEYADQIARSEDEIKKRLGFEGAENKYDVVSMYNQGMYNYGALSESGKKAASEFENAALNYARNPTLELEVALDDKGASAELDALSQKIAGLEESDKVALGFDADATADEIYQIGIAYSEYEKVIEQANKVAQLKSQGITGTDLKVEEDALLKLSESIASLPDYVQTYYGFTPTDNADEIIEQLNALPEDKVVKFGLVSSYSDVDLEEANQVLKDRGYTNTTFNLSAEGEELETQIAELEGLLAQFEEEGTLSISTDGVPQTQALLAALLRQRNELNQPLVMQLDTADLAPEISGAVTTLQGFLYNYQELQIQMSVKADTTQAEQNLSGFITQLYNMDEATLATLNLDTTEAQAAISRLQGNVDVGGYLNPDDLAIIEQSISSTTPEMLVDLGVDSTILDQYLNTNKDTDVKLTPDSTAIEQYLDAPKSTKVTLGYDSSAISEYLSTPFYKTVMLQTTGIGGAKNSKSGGSSADGTAHAFGTAYARGTWGLATGGRALVGELGRIMPPYAVMCTCKFI